MVRTWWSSSSCLSRLRPSACSRLAMFSSCRQRFSSVILCRWDGTCHPTQRQHSPQPSLRAQLAKAGWGAAHQRVLAVDSQEHGLDCPSPVMAAPQAERRTHEGTRIMLPHPCNPPVPEPSQSQEFSHGPRAIIGEWVELGAGVVHDSSLEEPLPPLSDRSAQPEALCPLDTTTYTHTQTITNQSAPSPAVVGWAG